MPSIHFVERLENFKLVEEQENEWESGFWIVSKESAHKLLDGDLYLHAGQNEPSFCGGVIVGYRLVKDGKIVFRFKRMKDYEGITAQREGWGNEQKRIWD